jgi:hypothetical protein
VIPSFEAVKELGSLGFLSNESLLIELCKTFWPIGQKKNLRSSPVQSGSPKKMGVPLYLVRLGKAVGVGWFREKIPEGS